MGKRILGLVFWLLVSLLLQSTVVPALGGLLRHLDLVLALTVTAALRYGPKEGAAFGLVAGLLRDVVLGFGLGFYTIPLFVVGYGIGQFSQIVFRDSILVPFLAGLGSAVVYWAVLTLMNGFLYDHWLTGRFWLQLLLMLLVNSLIVPVVYALFNRPGRQVDVGSRG